MGWKSQDSDVRKETMGMDQKEYVLWRVHVQVDPMLIYLNDKLVECLLWVRCTDCLGINSRGA